MILICSKNTLKIIQRPGTRVRNSPSSIYFWNIILDFKGRRLMQ
jgi:hypothetical protein